MVKQPIQSYFRVFIALVQSLTFFIYHWITTFPTKYYFEIHIKRLIGFGVIIIGKILLFIPKKSRKLSLLKT